MSSPGRPAKGLRRPIHRSRPRFERGVAGAIYFRERAWEGGSRGPIPTLYRRLPGLARADPDRLADGQDEDLAIADGTGLGRRADRRHDLVHQVVRHHHLDLDLGQEVDRVLRAPVELRVALLAAEAAHLGDGHADDTQLVERLLDVVELERLDHGLDLLHPVLRSRAALGLERLAVERDVLAGRSLPGEILGHGIADERLPERGLAIRGRG